VSWPEILVVVNSPHCGFITFVILQDNGFSQGSTFTNAVNSDICVPDAYAQTNLAEDYAQVTVVFLYKLWHPRNPPPGTECMSAQLKAVASSRAVGVQDYIQATGAFSLRLSLHPAQLCLLFVLAALTNLSS